MLFWAVVDELGFEVEAEIFNLRLVFVHDIGCRPP